MRFSQTIRMSVLTLGVATVSWALPALTQALPTPPSQLAQTSPTPQPTLSPLDQQFIVDAARGGLIEVSLGQLAAQKGTTDAIQKYGQQMAQEHTKANNQLIQLAKQKGITPPTDLGKYEVVRSHIAQLSGADFDRAYANEGGINGHLESLAVYNRQAELGQDPDLRRFADQTLPIIRRHFEQAQTLSTPGSGSR
jgi:putative membrane protein